MNGLAHGLAAQIPERHFHRAQRMNDHAAPAVHGRAEIDALPQFADLEWVGANQKVLDRESHRMCAGRFDTGLRHPRVGIALSYAGYPAIRVDNDNQAVLSRRSEGHIIVGSQQDMTVNRSDLEAGAGCC